MAVLEILKYPDERLARKAKPVTAVDAGLLQTAQDMLETMYSAEGIGLAAPQVGIDLRLVVIDLSETRDHPVVLINPKVIGGEGESLCEEGCLSIPDVREKVKRYEKVVVEAQDVTGAIGRIETDGLYAICLQHEIDHLDGVLFVDHLSRLKRSRIRKRLIKQAAEDQ